MAEQRQGGPVIKPIDKASVHRICSGQVILDLSMAVKELVENSLDARATSIEIKLKDYGAESLEVADNGCGVSPDNYQALTLKYHTSKISEFADLQSLSSFGFRGEALSSLCALGDLSVVTRTRNEPIATHLQFDHSGCIISKKSEARPIGTTVILTGLFKPLPVRHKEFIKNMRREYSRLLTVLHGYALIAKNVRLVCTHLTGKTRTMILKTQGTSSIMDNIITVFGTKMAACLEPVDLLVGNDSQIEGFVSKPGSGSGRPSGDRQFFYINGRPVELPKVSKMLNELYRSFNSQQFPMAVLNFILPTITYDVNVTPDKRKVFLHAESELLQAFRQSLETIYAPEKYTFVVQKFENKNFAKESSMHRELPEFETQKCDIEESPLAIEHVQADLSDSKNDNPVSSTEIKEEEDFDDSFKKSTNGGAAHAELDSFQCNVSIISTDFRHGSISTEKTGKIDFTLKKKQQAASLQQKAVQSKLNGFVLPAKRSANDAPLSSEEPLLKKWLLTEHTALNFKDLSGCRNGKPHTEDVELDLTDTSTKDKSGSLSHICEPSCPHADVQEIEGTESPENHLSSMQSSDVMSVPEDSKVSMTEEPKDIKGSLSKESEAVPADSFVEFDLRKLQARFEKSFLRYDDNDSRRKLSRTKRPFLAASMGLDYVAPSDSVKEEAIAAATRELERTFNKADFKKMKVLGQFNLGFILAKLNGDLFIIDQHASDEKFNFERLSKTTILNRQPLLRPLPLDFSAAEEVIAMTHIETFRKNGFDFIEKREGPLGRRLFLSAVPFSKNITFGSSDVQELISLLAEEPTSAGSYSDQAETHTTSGSQIHGHNISCAKSLVRPSRVRAMLASRACRSSIMIGDPLSKKEMQKILGNLAELDSPWNCPHGRPTMRHLVDLTNVKMSSRFNMEL